MNAFPPVSRTRGLICVIYLCDYKISTAKSTAKRLAPIAALFLPAEPVKTAVGEVVAFALPFAVVVATAKVDAGTVVLATPALPMVGAPVMRTAPPLEVVKTT